MISVFILIPVHNNLHLTKQCIPHLAGMINKENKKETVQYALTVIDDGSSDGTCQWIHAHHPEVTVLKGDGNLWWSGSINKGALHAFQKEKADFVLLWNNDVLPKEDYFTQLTQIIEHEDQNTILGSKICSLNDPLQIWSMGGKFNPITGKFFMYGLDKTINPDEQHLIEPDWLTGMGTLIPKKTVNQIGYWNDNKFPQYFGDTDYTYRAKLAGFKLKVSHQLILYNDTDNTGMIHGGNLSKLIQSLLSNRSKYNFNKDWMFYRTHAKSWMAYYYIFIKYFRYIGGFFKWKVLYTLGIQK